MRGIISGDRARRSGLRRSGGFTLVEIAVYLAVFSMIIVSAIQVLSSTQDSQERGTEAADSRQNARASMAMITKEARAAGSGIGSVPITASYDDQPLSLYAVDKYAAAPGFTMTGAMDSTSTILAARMDEYTSDIQCARVTGFSIGDLVMVTDNVTAHMFQVTAIPYGLTVLRHASSSPYNPSSAYADWPANGYEAGSQVRKLRIVTYYLDEGEHAIIRSEVGKDPTYVAGGIDSLNVSYILSDGSTTQAPADPTEIRAIAFTIRSRSGSLRGEDGDSQVLETTIAPRCVIK